MKQIILRILKSIRGKKSNEFNKSRSNDYNKSNSYTSYNHGYRGDNDKDAKQKVNMIKRLLMQDIEQAIDKRLHSIFFSEKNRSH